MRMNDTAPLLVRRRTALSLGIALGFATVPHAGSAAPGDPLGPAVRVDTPTATGSVYSPSVASDAAGNFAVAWQDYGQAEPSNPPTILLRLFGADGTARGDAQTVNTLQASSYNVFDSPVVAMDQAGDAVVAWSGAGSTSYGSVYARRYDASGQPKDDGFQVDDAPSGSQIGPPGVAMDADGNFVLAWTEESPPIRLIPGAYDSPMLVFSSVHARRYSADGTAARDQTLKVGMFGERPSYRPEFPTQAAMALITADAAPAVAIDAQSNVAVAWLEERYLSNGIEAVRLSSKGIQQGLKFSPHPVFGRFPQTMSAGMSADGQLTLVWEPDSIYSNVGLYAQRWPARGPSSRAFTVQPRTGSDFVSSSGVAVNAAGQSVVAWITLNGPSYTHTVLAQMYAADGSPVGNPVVISDQGDDHTRSVSVAMAADGSFVVAWRSGGGLWVQRFEGGY